MAVNVSWMNHLTNEEIYRELPKVSIKVQQRRMRLAGHCIRHKEEVSSKLILWHPTEGKTNGGRRNKTFVDNLLQDTGMVNTQELRTIMSDREEWKKRVKAAGRPDGRPRRLGKVHGQNLYKLVRHDYQSIITNCDACEFNSEALEVMEVHA